MFRIIKVAWDKNHLKLVKAAYKMKYTSRGSLKARIEGDTSGDQQKLLIALVNSDVPESK